MLNRQVAEYEADVKASSHTLSSHVGPTYDPSASTSSEVEAEAFAHRLGGSSALTSVGGDGEEDSLDRIVLIGHLIPLNAIACHFKARGGRGQK